MISRLLDELGAGATIYLPGATGEILALTDALAQEPQRMSDVHLLSCMLPGMNSFDYAALDPTARMTLFMLPPSMHASYQAGRVRLLPLSYSGAASYIARDAHIHTAIVHVSPPGKDGRCSFGVAADFSPIAWEAASRRVAVVNPSMPFVPGPTIDLADADASLEIESPLVEVAAPLTSPEVGRIAAHAATLVPDGAGIQIGLGGAPAGMWRALSNHRGLRLRSGLATDGVKLLANAGALDMEAKHRSGILCGSADFYADMAAQDWFELADTRTTHSVGVLAAERNFFAANSALEVDLFGQVNVEWQGASLSGGVGGAPDFVRGAARSEGGRSMVLLPATARQNSVSRIVPRLAGPSVSLTRDLIDTVVTEHGVAELRGRSMDDRAAALIAIAEPSWRDGLERDWRAMRARF